MNCILKQNESSWDAMAESWFGTTALPVYGCYIPTEEQLQLFPDLHGKKVMDFGCGSGHSLRWCAEQGAKELWGLDLSGKQIAIAQKFLTENGLHPHLIHSAMEAEYELPQNYFDVVFSIYAIGWTTDLAAAIRNMAGCLKTGGHLIFSWDHPLMRCLDAEQERLIFTGSYLADEAFSYIQRGQPVTVQNWRLSTYINTLADAGFTVERLIEESDKSCLDRAAEFSSGYYTPWKASKIPLSFVIKARKL